MPASHDAYAALRFRSFRWFIIALVAVTVATQLRGVVVAWQIYDATRDPLSLGLIGLAEAVPFIGTALYAGHVADRRNRRLVALAALLLVLGCAVALLALTLRRPPETAGDVAPFYAVIFVSGIARSFLMPARTALAAELVPRHVYANATAWRTSSWQLAAVAGPAIGGLLYAAFGPALVYALDVVLMVVAVLALAVVRAPERTPPRAVTGIRESLTSGLRFVLREPVILGAMTLDLVSVLFGGAVALLPVFASEILHAGPEGLGILRAAPAAGAVLTALWLAHRPPFERAGRAMLVNVALFGACMIGFALSRNFALSVALLVASGAVDTVSVVIRGTLLQVLTPDELLGRVAAVNAIFIGSSNEIGAFESGVAARLLGTVPSVVVGGMMTLLAVGVTAWKVPSLRELGAIRGRIAPVVQSAMPPSGASAGPE